MPIELTPEQEAAYLQLQRGERPQKKKEVPSSQPLESDGTTSSTQPIVDLSLQKSPSQKAYEEVRQNRAPFVQKQDLSVRQFGVMKPVASDKGKGILEETKDQTLSFFKGFGTGLEEANKAYKITSGLTDAVFSNQEDKFAMQIEQERKARLSQPQRRTSMGENIGQMIGSNITGMGVGAGAGLAAGLINPVAGVVAGGTVGALEGAYRGFGYQYQENYDEIRKKQEEEWNDPKSETRLKYKDINSPEAIMDAHNKAKSIAITQIPGDLAEGAISGIPLPGGIANWLKLAKAGKSITKELTKKVGREAVDSAIDAVGAMTNAVIKSEIGAQQGLERKTTEQIVDQGIQEAIFGRGVSAAKGAVQLGLAKGNISELTKSEQQKAEERAIQTEQAAQQEYESTIQPETSTGVAGEDRASVGEITEQPQEQGLEETAPEIDTAVGQGEQKAAASVLEQEVVDNEIIEQPQEVVENIAEATPQEIVKQETTIAEQQPTQTPIVKVQDTVIAPPAQPKDTSTIEPSKLKERQYNKTVSKNLDVPYFATQYVQQSRSEDVQNWGKYLAENGEEKVLEKLSEIHKAIYNPQLDEQGRVARYSTEEEANIRGASQILMGAYAQMEHAEKKAGNIEAYAQIVKHRRAVQNTLSEIIGNIGLDLSRANAYSQMETSSSYEAAANQIKKLRGAESLPSEQLAQVQSEARQMAEQELNAEAAATVNSATENAIYTSVMDKPIKKQEYGKIRTRLTDVVTAKKIQLKDTTNQTQRNQIATDIYGLNLLKAALEAGMGFTEAINKASDKTYQEWKAKVNGGKENMLKRAELKARLRGMGYTIAERIVPEAPTPKATKEAETWLNGVPELEATMSEIAKTREAYLNTKSLYKDLSDKIKTIPKVNISPSVFNRINKLETKIETTIATAQEVVALANSINLDSRAAIAIMEQYEQIEISKDLHRYNAQLLQAVKESIDEINNLRKEAIGLGKKINELDLNNEESVLQASALVNEYVNKVSDLFNKFQDAQNTMNKQAGNIMAAQQDIVNIKTTQELASATKESIDEIKKLMLVSEDYAEKYIQNYRNALGKSKEFDEELKKVKAMMRRVGVKDEKTINANAANILALSIIVQDPIFKEQAIEASITNILMGGKAMSINASIKANMLLDAAMNHPIASQNRTLLISQAVGIVINSSPFSMFKALREARYMSSLANPGTYINILTGNWIRQEVQKASFSEKKGLGQIPILQRLFPSKNIRLIEEYTKKPILNDFAKARLLTTLAYGDITKDPLYKGGRGTNYAQGQMFEVEKLAKDSPFFGWFTRQMSAALRAIAFTDIMVAPYMEARTSIYLAIKEAAETYKKETGETITEQQIRDNLDNIFRYANANAIKEAEAILKNEGYEKPDDVSITVAEATRRAYGDKSIFQGQELTEKEKKYMEYYTRMKEILDGNVPVEIKTESKQIVESELMKSVNVWQEWRDGKKVEKNTLSTQIAKTSSELANAIENMYNESGTIGKAAAIGLDALHFGAFAFLVPKIMSMKDNIAAMPGAGWLYYKYLQNNAKKNKTIMNDYHLNRAYQKQIIGNVLASFLAGIAVMLAPPISGDDDKKFYIRFNGSLPMGKTRKDKEEWERKHGRNNFEIVIDGKSYFLPFGSATATTPLQIASGVQQAVIEAMRVIGTKEGDQEKNYARLFKTKLLKDGSIQDNVSYIIMQAAIDIYGSSMVALSDNKYTSTFDKIIQLAAKAQAEDEENRGDFIARESKNIAANTATSLMHPIIPYYGLVNFIEGAIYQQGVSRDWMNTVKSKMPLARTLGYVKPELDGLGEPVTRYPSRYNMAVGATFSIMEAFKNYVLNEKDTELFKMSTFLTDNQAFPKNDYFGTRYTLPIDVMYNDSTIKDLERKNRLISTGKTQIEIDGREAMDYYARKLGDLTMLKKDMLYNAKNTIKLREYMEEIGKMAREETDAYILKKHGLTILPGDLGSDYKKAVKYKNTIEEIENMKPIKRGE